MNVLMILESSFPPDVRVEKEIRTLTNQGHKIFLLAISKKPHPINEKFGKLEIYRFRQTKLMYKLSALALSLPFYFNFWKKNIQDFLSTNKIDIIHLHDLPLASVVYHLGMDYNIPVIFDFHENRPEIMKLYAHTNSLLGRLLISYKKWEQYQNRYSRLADRLILITPEAKNYYLKKYEIKPSSVFVVPNYADVENLEQIKPKHEIISKYSNKFMLVYFGDTGLRRGTRTIIEAAKYLENQTEFHFVIIGNSKEQFLLSNMVKAYKLKNVELTGYLDFETIASYIMASKSGLCPFLRNIHHDTTYANKLFQYMFFGKPVIVSDCPAQVNIVNESNTGLVHKANDPKDLSLKIMELKNQSDYKQLSLNAKNAVRKRYNTKMGFMNLVKLYESIGK